MNKVTIGLGMVIATISAHICASEYVIRTNPNQFDIMSKWILVESVSPSQWFDYGEAYNCDEFSPLPNTIELGMSFTQSKRCEQKQTGIETNHYKDEFSGATKTELENTDRVVPKQLTQEATGTLDINAFWVLNPTTHTDWINTGEQFSCSEWLPLTSQHKVGFLFEQSQSCSQNQSRLAITTETNTYTNETRTVSEITEQKVIPEGNKQHNYGENSELSGMLSGNIDTFGTSCSLINSGSRSYTLLPDTTLSLGTHITTCSGYTFALQVDGNFVINKDGGTIWSTHTQNKNASHMALQGDGNVVIYAEGTAIWNFETQGNANARLAFQEDGNFVLYGSDGKVIKAR